MRKLDIVRRHVIRELSGGVERDKISIFRGKHEWGDRLRQRALSKLTTSRMVGYGEEKRVWYKLDLEYVRSRRVSRDKFGAIIIELRERMLDTEDPAERIALSKAIKKLNRKDDE